MTLCVSRVMQRVTGFVCSRIGGLFASSIRSYARKKSPPFKKHVVPFLSGDKYNLSLSNGKQIAVHFSSNFDAGIKRISIRMRRPDRSRLLGGFWENKLLSPSLWALGIGGKSRTDKSSDETSLAAPRPERKMADSYCEVLLPFRTEPKLAEEYASIHGGIRVGKLLEDLDVLAASIAYIHCDDLDLTIVTAAIDRIDLLLPIDATLSDVRLRGSVTYVGKSSIEVTISVETDQSSSKDNLVWELAALAKFILVARTPSGTKSVQVNKLGLDSDRQKEICKRGQQRQEYRRRRSEQSLYKQPPVEGEVRLVHEICMGGHMPSVIDDSAFPLKQIPMEDTKTSSLRICHPQEQNIHGYMFGGYLCREAFELAFATATVFFVGKRPSLKSIDDIVFVHPVPIGSIMDLKAEVIHSRLHEGELYACIQVIADIINPSTQSRLTTNTFHFTLTHPISSFTDIAIPSVLPKTYVEAMKFLEGKRRVDFDLESSMSQTDRDKHLLNPPHYDPTIDKTQ